VPEVNPGGIAALGVFRQSFTFGGAIAGGAMASPLASVPCVRTDISSSSCMIAT